MSRPSAASTRSSPAKLRKRFETLRATGLLSAAPNAPPERLGDFRLLRQLGGGGMGVVWVAEQESLRCEVALKLVRSDQLWFPGSKERFRREAEAVARLEHRAIVQVFAVGEQDGVPWLAMELLRAGADRALPWRPAAGIADRRQPGASDRRGQERST